ncbi:uncharacterized protein [Henckelia pumila]|uniref:uncharacterized protein n=1 Tax=Henckelia pumila TaxID=405737 RepID=UPI003C6DDA8D
MKMKECNRDGYSECCCIHPTHTVVGVCAFCLNDRLLVLAANSHQTRIRRLHENKNIHTFYDMFSVKGLQHRIEVKKKKSDGQNLIITPSVCSQEDSFISIKFGDNGVASWDKENISKAAAPLDHQSEYDNCNDAKNIISVVDHAKHRAAMLRWRRRIGHILHLVRWKRSSKGNNMCHGAKFEGANFRYGWMRNLTKNRGLFG